MALQVAGLKPRADVPAFGDHRAWAAFWGEEAKRTAHRVINGMSSDVFLDMLHVKRAAGLAMMHAAHVTKYRYWDARWCKVQLMKMTRKEWRATVIAAQTLIRSGQSITAIKLLRDRTNCGLKEAYDAVNKLREHIK